MVPVLIDFCEVYGESKFVCYVLAVLKIYNIADHPDTLANLIKYIDFVNLAEHFLHSVMPDLNIKKLMQRLLVHGLDNILSILCCAKAIPTHRIINLYS